MFRGGLAIYIWFKIIYCSNQISPRLSELKFHIDRYMPKIKFSFSRFLGIRKLALTSEIFAEDLDINLFKAKVI